MEIVSAVMGSLSWPWWWTLVVGAVPVVGWLLWSWNELWYAAPNEKLPPGHMGLPFFGEMIAFLWYFKILRRPDDFINAKRRKYGDGEGLYRTHLFGSPSIIACLPPVTKFVFQTEDTFVLQRPNPELFGPASLGVVQGPAIARLRGCILNAINRPHPLRRFASLVQPGVVAALQSWAQRGRIKAYDEVKKVSFEGIGKSFMSLEPGSRLDNIDQLFSGFLKGLRAQPFNFPGTAFRHALQCRKKLDAIFSAELEKKKARQEEATDDDLIDCLMRIEDESGSKLSDQELVDNIVNLLVAGYATTSTVSTWAIYYLAKYPEVLEKLREENMSISQRKKGEFITSEDISMMKYTNMVVEESIRLANIAPTLARSVSKDVDYKGYKIPKGWQMLVWVRYLHMNAENFEDPMRFNPERWNKPARSGTYQVFGGGSRICTGNMLARLQIAILLHHLSVGYKWELINPNAGIDYLPSPTPADGVEVTFSKL